MGQTSVRLVCPFRFPNQTRNRRPSGYNCDVRRRRRQIALWFCHIVVLGAILLFTCLYVISFRPGTTNQYTKSWPALFGYSPARHVTWKRLPTDAYSIAIFRGRMVLAHAAAAVAAKSPFVLDQAILDYRLSGDPQPGGGYG